MVVKHVSLTHFILLQSDRMATYPHNGNVRISFVGTGIGLYSLFSPKFLYKIMRFECVPRNMNNNRLDSMVPTRVTIKNESTMKALWNLICIFMCT